MKTIYELAKEGILPEYAVMTIWANLLARITDRKWEDVVWYVCGECDSGMILIEPKENWPHVKDEHGHVVSRDNFLRYLNNRNELPEVWAHYLNPELKSEQPKPVKKCTTGQTVSINGNLQAALQEAGRKSAKLQHAERNRLYGEVVNEASLLWKKGDPRKHSYLANYFKANEKYSLLSPKTLRVKLADLARTMGHPELVKGAKKKG